MKDYTYKDNATLYNKVEDIPGEKEMLIYAVEYISSLMRNRINKKFALLDLCCGTELILDLFPRHVLGKIEQFIGVDISAAYLRDAKKRLNDHTRFSLVHHDAVTYRAGKMFDIVIASSAYHHIEDSRKLKFLANIYNHLAPGGVVIFMENILPLYKTAMERKVSAIEFYAKRIVDCLDIYGIRDERIILLSRIMQYERDRIYEWKSHYVLFKKHLSQSGLKVVSEKKVWPRKNIFHDPTAGDYVFICRKSRTN